jgi:hypothetical protein
VRKVKVRETLVMRCMTDYRGESVASIWR